MQHLDIDGWSRRELFEFFRGFDNPYFNICVRLDVTNLLSLIRRYSGVGVSLAYHYFALRAANEVAPFRYRLRAGKVVIHDVIHGGTTVLLPNESFTFAYFDYEEDFGRFVIDAKHQIEAVKAGTGTLVADPADDKIHFTTFPWASFTSFAHARNWGREDSVPKIAFGKFEESGEHSFLPIPVEVHHALMDGVHVGRYLIRLQEMLNEPHNYLGLE